MDIQDYSTGDESGDKSSDSDDDRNDQSEEYDMTDEYEKLKKINMFYHEDNDKIRVHMHFSTTDIVPLAFVLHHMQAPLAVTDQAPHAF